MLEGLAAWILNTYVGEYVENLNTTQLSIALLQGAVELDNLPLKRDALKSLDLPLEVKSGFIGKITLQIPLRRLRSEPWVISIKKLYLVAGPLKHTEYNEAAEKKSNQARKLAMLDALEAKWQLHKAEKQESYGSSWFSYGTSVAANILENLQLIIEDVHIRYEDDSLIPSCPFAFGIVIKKLSAQSTDGNWTAKFVSSDGTNMMHKLARLDNFSVYLDSNATLLGNLPHDQLSDALQREMFVNKVTKQFQDHEYILAPVSAQAKVKRNTSALPLRSVDAPRITLDVSLEKLDFRLSEEQYHTLVQFLKEMELHDRRMKYRKWRPYLSIKESPSAWWQFAISANLEKIEERNKRHSWEFLSQRIRDVRVYYSIYSKYLKTQQLDDKQTTQKKRIEEDLGFDELKMIREIVYHRVKKDGKLYKPPTEVKEQPSPEQQGVLQRWFPGWSGWYGYTSPSSSGENIADPKKSGSKEAQRDSKSRPEDVGEPPPPKIAKAEIEQEILDVIHDTAENTSFLKKDTVFALMNFNLKSGSFQLQTRSSPIFSSNPANFAPLSTILELECTTVDMLFESRPRSSAMKFEMGVGGLYLRDKMTEKTIFPNILSPQPKERILLFRSPSNSHNASQTTSSSSGSSSTANKDDTLFQLKYEKNPANAKANYRISIQTKPLDIVYSPAMVKRVREFFSSRKTSFSRSSNLKLTEAAMRHYAAFKEQTRAELQHTLENLLEGEETQAKRWEINLDISAPQIMVPENFTDTASNMVVLDLGHLHFYNKAVSKGTEKQKKEDADDEFQTPPSTPPNEPVVSSMDSPDFSNLTEDQLYDKLYEKYCLDLNDLQVMVGKPKDNWKQARGRGVTHLHVIDKFNINLQLERRLVYTSDPRWPSTTVSGNLPSLTVHLNEQKVLSLRTCVDTLTTPTAYKVPYDMSVSVGPYSISESPSGDLSEASGDISDQSLESSRRLDDKVKDVLEESRLVVAQFSINNLSLEIQSRDRALVELQVSKVRANFTKRPYDSTVSLSVHSLLVADALQTYGQDFELLVASHRNVMLDSKSGSILGSDPASPLSAASPPSPHSPMETLPQSTSVSSLHSVQEAISSAFQKLMKSASKASQLFEGVAGDHSHGAIHLPDAEALISLELDMLDANSPSNMTGAPLKVANVQFNSLDIIANQETMMELLGFLKVIAPSRVQESPSGTSLSHMKPLSVSQNSLAVPEKSRDKIEVTADFNRMNLLLMRIEDGHAYKVATATMSSAKVQATIDKDLDVSGSLGGFHILDVSSEDVTHQQIFGVGSDVTGSHGNQSKLSASCFPPPDIMYKTAHEESILRDEDEEVRAFSFHFYKGLQTSSTVQNMGSLHVNKSRGPDLAEENVMHVNVEMASMCYVHSPRLLHDISECLSEFKDYARSVADSIKTAAAEVAMGIVTKKAVDTSMFGSANSLNQSHDDMDAETGGDAHFTIGEIKGTTEKDSSAVIISAKLQTPVIVIPCTPTSSEVLVAHLGEITVRNMEEEESETSPTCSSSSKMFIAAKDMNLYSMNLDSLNESKSESSGEKSFYSPNQFQNSHDGTPIVYDTTVEITIESKAAEVPQMTRDDHMYFGEDSFTWKSKSSEDVSQPSDVMEISAKIATPLKLQLCKSVYEQILQTTDNLTYDERIHRTRSSSVTTSPRTSKTDVLVEKSEDTKQEKPSPKASSPQRSKKPDKQITTKINFEVPLFNVELKGDFDAGERGMIDLKLSDFALLFEKKNPYCTDIQIYLKSLVMEDLLANTDSQDKYLLISRDRKKEEEEEHKPKLFLSMSCPDSTILSPSPRMPQSLPVSFHDNMNNIHQSGPGRGKSASHHNQRTMPYPQTPPPSIRTSRRVSQDLIPEDSLVHITVKLIDKNSPEYKEKYNRTNRFIDVDFNSLDANINLQTWVMLMDFLGMGSKIPDVSSLQKMEDAVPREEGSVIRMPASEEPTVNSVINLTVKSFILAFNKPEYELGRAIIESWSSHINLRDGNFAISGQLGHAALVDMTPHGELYKERFVTAGDQALIFDIFKYGSPDPNLTRDCDISVKLQMASVRYVHTNRFQIEFVAFLQHFLQLQDVLGRYRAASAGKKVTDKATRGSRIKLNIEAKSPIILFPHSSRTTDVLVADFGNLTIKNCFRYDGEEGTLSAVKHLEAQEKAQMKRRGSKESLSSMATSDTSEYSQDNTFHSMTQSVFDQYNPPVRSSTHPMLQSIYGSLDSDLRSPDTVSFDLDSESEIYDPTDSPKSPDGTSVDPEFFPESGSWLSISSALPSQSQLQASTRSSRSAGKIRRTPSGNSLRQLVSVDADQHICLLDQMDIDLTEMDLYSAERVKKGCYHGNLSGDLEFKSCVIQRQGGKLLKDKCRFKLKVERNLEGDISHSAPDWKVQGALSSVHFSLDLTQYKLIRGILEHNLGEKLPEFQRPLMSHLMDPENQTVLSGKVWQGIALAIDLNNVTVELLVAHAQGSDCPEASLAKLDFICSTLKFDSYSDQSKDVDLVSHEIVASDTRYRDAPVNVRPNMFEKILQPGPTSNKSDTFQLVLHYRSTKEANKFSILLNSMKLMCVFDWLLTLQEFILTNPDDPFKQSQENLAEADEGIGQGDDDSVLSSGSRTTSPVTVSSGIMTKRGPLVEEVETPFELKLNVSDTQFVVVEDSTSLDTNAVILKSTAVMNYRPKAQDKLVSCTLQPIEVFSCSLLAEEETALSIIDPLTIHIDLNANPLLEPKLSSSAGLVEARQAQERNLQLEITFNTMNIRLSYHDMNMFLAILNSLPEQALKAAKRESQTRQSKYPVNKINSLRDLGFSENECENALEASDMNLEAAAIWLTQHGTPLPKPKNKSKQQSQEKGLTLTGIEVKSTCISLCLIDDCGDSDVPLAEVDFNNVEVKQKLMPQRTGKACFHLTGDFYNRSLSGWEPFLEKWRCHCEWNQFAAKGEKKTSFQVNAPEVLNINITSSMLEQYNKTKQSWSEDYNRQRVPANTLRSDLTSPSSSSCLQRRRVPFVPFMLHNQTGCKLWFATVTTTAIKHKKTEKHKEEEGHIKASDWKPVEPDERVPFLFQRKEKIRHQKTHDLRVNQLMVKVEGWEKLNTVTVDKVGVYFRHTEPEKKQATGLASLASSSSPESDQLARVVFDVQQEGSARKVITVRSALIIRNRLDSKVDLKLASGSKLDGKFNIIEIPAGDNIPVPLPYVNTLLYIRPSDWPVRYCRDPIQWQHVGLAGQVKDRTFRCDTNDSSGGVYRFCASVKRENYPEQLLTSDSTQIIPGHTITLLPPVVVHNLLPVDMRYYIKNTPIAGSIRPGKTAPLHSADPQTDIELGVHLENFPKCKELLIPPDTTFYKVKLRLFDQKDRLLELLVKIISRKGGSVNLYILSPYWLVNRSGLPLVFSQDSASQEAAGQFEEHELAKSVTPLLFSYVEKELPDLCSMRVGKSVKGANSVPIWCSRFSLESGVGMRRLTVVPKDKSRPDWLVQLQTQAKMKLAISIARVLQIYNIGIEVRKGKGKYNETNIVTFAPLYEIDNRSSHKLAVAQRHIALGEESRIDGHLTALPNCKLPFHWPRLDLDQLLCVMLLEKKVTHWSGGFRIDKTSSFHINMRDDAGNNNLLKVEVVQQGPTFFIVFGDAGEVPPPFRIDNLSEVPLLYWQKQAEDTKHNIKTWIKPHTTIPYAWDEPILDHMIALKVQSGTESVYDMDQLGEGTQLCYSNLIYLAATSTFNRGSSEDRQNLVLEVVEQNYIKFMPKEKGNRNQLWRMTSQGMLEHEGSMAPRDPHRSSTSVKSLVLDINDIALQPDKIVPLTLKKPDERRRSTQTWYFTEDGRLCSSVGVLCIQVLGGEKCLQPMAVAVLGPCPASPDNRIPPHMQISRQKLMPGSGCLSVRITMDGPIRVLQITDISQRQIVRKVVSKKYEDWEVYDEMMSGQDDGTPEKSSLELNMSLKGGFGISLINKVPQEIVYVTLGNIQVDYVSHPNSVTVDVVVGSVQVDNQLFDTQKPVLLFVTRTSSRDAPDNTPALHIAAHKIPNAEWNAEIYKYFIISMKKLSIQLEEKVLWKLLQFAGMGQDNNVQEQISMDEDPRKALVAATSVQSKRYYFGQLKINTSRVTLSMFTATKLPPDLRAIKQSTNLPLVKFEDAKVDLDPFVKFYPFETWGFLQKEIMIHYTEELKSQAAKILGSVDFLGNPLGLFNDVTEGISGLIKDGNVGGLFKNVTHGLSNSTAKVASSLSDTVGNLNMDNVHNERRERIRNSAQSSGEHLVAGVKGFGYGLFGALSSIVTQPVRGFREDGMEGFITGIGKGVVGTVTKPVAGVLDLASGAANALKDTSTCSSKVCPPRVRKPRCCHGPGRLLPAYSEGQAKSQELLHKLNLNKHEEYFIALEQLRAGKDDGLLAMITSEQVYFMKRGASNPDNIILQVRYQDLQLCFVVKSNDRFYVELMLTDKSAKDKRKRPQVRCNKEYVAQRVAQQINYAFSLYDELKHTLIDNDLQEDTFS